VSRGQSCRPRAAGAGGVAAHFAPETKAPEKTQG